MEDDAYELVSSEEVSRLKREIEHLKSNPFIQNSSDSRLFDAVQNLNESVTKLYVLFENVNKQLMKEYQEGESPEEKLDKILDQNRNIAEALVTFVSKNEQVNEVPAPMSGQAAQANQITQEEIPFPAMQQPMQIRPQMPLDSFNGAPINQMPQMNQAPQMQQAQMQRFNPATMPQNINQASQMQQPVQMNPQFNQPQMQESFQQPIQQQKFGFGTKLDPNYPSPDNFPTLNMPPSFGEPINVEPKKKGFLGLGKK